MANALYDKARESFLKGEISWSGDNVKVVLVDLADYTPDLANDQYLSDVPAESRVATSLNLSGKTTAAGVADADNVTLASVTGDPSEAQVLYQDTAPLVRLEPDRGRQVPFPRLSRPDRPVLSPHRGRVLRPT